MSKAPKTAPAKKPGTAPADAGQQHTADADTSVVVSDLDDYEVVSILDHDGERYEVGDQVSLTPKQADSLLGHTVKPLKAA